MKLWETRKMDGANLHTRYNNRQAETVFHGKQCLKLHKELRDILGLQILPNDDS